MSGLEIDWSLVAGAMVFAAVMAICAGWRGNRRRKRRHPPSYIRRRTRGAAPPSPRWARSPTQAQPAQAAFTLRRFWVVDGDTIQDNATKTIYRLETIDCPETEDRAQCYRERKMGERAKFEAIRLLKGAATIVVHPTGNIDPYGRSIASIDVDGQDFGQLMIARGFARPWRGVREDWCGPNGGLARMAEACSAKFHCKTCGGRTGIIDQQTGASLLAIDPAPAETLEESPKPDNCQTATPQSGS